VTEQRPWAVRLTLLASDTELESIINRIGAAICSPPDHPGPCPNPWSVLSTPVDDLDDDENRHGNRLSMNCSHNAAQNDASSALFAAE
jgi:hypothetical protein